jgi:hypothetical protein
MIRKCFGVTALLGILDGVFFVGEIITRHCETTRPKKERSSSSNHHFCLFVDVTLLLPLLLLPLMLLLLLLLLLQSLLLSGHLGHLGRLVHKHKSHLVLESTTDNFNIQLSTANVHSSTFKRYGGDYSTVVI